MTAQHHTAAAVPHHLDRGEGPAVVVLPGLAATAGFLADSVAELARDHRVLVLELPGHGERATERRGPEPAEGAGAATVASAAEALDTLLTARELTDVTLLGWSLGATVAWAYLERFGAARVRALVSVDQTPRLVLGEGWPHAAFGGLDKAGAEELVESVPAGYGAVAENLVRGSFAAGTEPAEAEVERLLAEAHRCSPVAVRSLLADAVAQDWRERLPAVLTGVPTLLVHGARSQVYPTAVGAWLAEALPGARLEVLETGGHRPFAEEPDRFHALVRAFVRTPTTDAPPTAGPAGTGAADTAPPTPGPRGAESR